MGFERPARGIQPETASALFEPALLYLNDVWNNITAGMIDRSNGEVARLAMSRWRRAAAIAR